MSNFDTSLVTDFNDAFKNCKGLKNINFGEDAKSWDTAEGKFMRSMFEGCSSLESLPLKKFKTTDAIVLNNMFKGCSSLTLLEINNFNVKNVNYMNEMFSGVTSLRYLDLSSFDTNNVISCDNIWKDIYNLTIKIDVSKNKKLLENKPDGIIIANETNLNDFI